jgi:hypothetical protein
LAAITGSFLQEKSPIFSKQLGKQLTFGLMDNKLVHRSIVKNQLKAFQQNILHQNEIGIFISFAKF